MRNWLIKKLVQTRNAFSHQLNNRRATIIWRPALTSVSYFEQWMLNHFVYKHDPLGGIIDNTKSVGHMFYQYKLNEGSIQGDCDDSATLYAWALKELRKDIYITIRDIWRVNIPRYRHVICVWILFQDGEEQFYYSSGRSTYHRVTVADTDYGWQSIREVVDAYGSRKEKRRLGVAFYAEPVSEIVLE